MPTASIAFAVKHLRDEDLAKDVVQESFARLWVKVHEVDATKAKSYLFTTAHHALVDEVRKGSRAHGWKSTTTTYAPLARTSPT